MSAFSRGEPHGLARARPARTRDRRGPGRPATRSRPRRAGSPRGTDNRAARRSRAKRATRSARAPPPPRRPDTPAFCPTPASRTGTLNAPCAVRNSTELAPRSTVTTTPAGTTFRAVPLATGLGWSGWFSNGTRLTSSFHAPSPVTASPWKKRQPSSFTSLPPVTETLPSQDLGRGAQPSERGAKRNGLSRRPARRRDGSRRPESRRARPRRPPPAPAVRAETDAFS